MKKKESLLLVELFQLNVLVLGVGRLKVFRADPEPSRPLFFRPNGFQEIVNLPFQNVSILNVMKADCLLP